MDYSSKLPNVGTTIFTVMSKLAIEHKAIDLSQGFPNFEADPKLLELAEQALKAGHNQYAPMQGIYSLREKITEKIASLHGYSYHPESEITITAGATQALFTAISTFVQPNDEVIVFKPAYDCYEPAIELYGGQVVPIQLAKDDFSIDWAQFKTNLNSNTKMVIINSPHNPSGTVLSKDDLLQLQEALKGTNVILLSDEVYEHIIFDGLAHESVSRFSDLAARSLICASFGKTFHVTGWKLGYIVGPKVLMEEFRKIHQYNVFCINHPIQNAVAAYLEDSSHYLELNQFYQEKRDYFIKAVNSSRFQFTPCKGTYFQVMRYPDITDESDVDFSKRLILEYGVASIPLSVFNLHHSDNGQLRFCFAKTKDTLDRAAEILNKI
ncbi:MAG: methionine aminotransferase [Bacteroidota bacterium]